MDSLAYPCSGTHKVTEALARYARVNLSVPLEFVKWEGVGYVAGFNRNEKDVREVSVVDTKSHRNNLGTAPRRVRHKLQIDERLLY